jgi:hypothetical protein
LSRSAESIGLAEMPVFGFSHFVVDDTIVVGSVPAPFFSARSSTPCGPISLTACFTRSHGGILHSEAYVRAVPRHLEPEREEELGLSGEVSGRSNRGGRR